MKKQVILSLICLVSLASCVSSEEEENNELIRLKFESISDINTVNQESYTLRGSCLDKGIKVDYIIQEIVEPPTKESTAPINPKPPFELVGSVQCEEDGTWEIDSLNFSVLPTEAKVKVTLSILGLKTDIVIVKDSQAPTVELDTIGSFVNAANEDRFTLSGTCSEDGIVSYRVGTVSGDVPCTQSEGWSVQLSLTNEPPGTLDIEISMKDLALNSVATPIIESVIKDTQAPRPVAGDIGVPINGTYYGGELNFYVEFDEIVVLSGTSAPRLILHNFSDGRGRYADYVSGSESTRLNFSYGINGDIALNGVSVVNFIDLDGGDAVIADEAGNHAVVEGLEGTGLLTGVIVSNTAFSLQGISVASADEKYHGVGQEISLTANFSHPATVDNTNGVPELLLKVGDNRNIRAAYSGSGTVFTYTVAAGENDDDGIQVIGVDLKGGTIRDDDDRNLVMDFVGEFQVNDGQVKVDTTAPLLIGMESDPTTPVKSKTWNLSCKDQNPCEYRFTVNQVSTAGNVLETITYRELTQQPTADQGDGLYYLHVQVKDTLDNEMTSPQTASVLLDNTGPSITDMALPSDGIYDVSDQLQFVLTFSEDIHWTGTTAPFIQLTFADGVTRNATSDAANTDHDNNPRTMRFTYEVERGVEDYDGIDLSSTLTVPPGTALRDLQGNDAVPNLPVSGHLSEVKIIEEVIPTLTGVTDNLGSATYHNANTIITLEAHFSAEVTVNLNGGSVVLNLQVGDDRNVTAVYAGSDGATSDTHNFSYTVDSAHSDDDGIEVTGLTLSSGATIRHRSGGNLDASGYSSEILSNTLVDTTPPLLMGMESDPTTPVKSKTWNLSCKDQNPCEYRFTVNQVSTAGNVLETATYGELTRQPTANQGDGLYYLHVQVKDTLDNEMTPPQTASVFLDNTGPSITDIALPSDGIYDVRDLLEFVVTFSEDIHWTGTIAPFIQLTFADGATRNAVLDASSDDHDNNPRTLRFLYEVEKGVEDHDGIELSSTLTVPPSTTLHDLLGNDAVPTLPVSGHLSEVKVIEEVIPTLTGVTNNLGSVTYHNANTIVTLEAHFSAEVTVNLNGGSAVLNLQVGNDRSVTAVYAGSDGATSDTHNFSYTVDSAHQDDDGIEVTGLTLSSGATIRHRSGGNLDASGYSSEILSNILVDNIAPGLAATNAVKPPAFSSYLSGQHMDFTVIFDEPIRLVGRGRPYITLAIGAESRNAELFTKLGNFRLILRYTVQKEDIDKDGIQLIGGVTLPLGVTIQDRAGNSASSITLETTSYPQLFVNKVLFFALEKLSLQDDTSCILMPTGGVRCWGKSDDGRLGNGQSSQDATTPWP